MSNLESRQIDPAWSQRAFLQSQVSRKSPRKSCAVSDFRCSKFWHFVIVCHSRGFATFGVKILRLPWIRICRCACFFFFGWFNLKGSRFRQDLRPWKSPLIQRCLVLMQGRHRIETLCQPVPILYDLQRYKILKARYHITNPKWESSQYPIAQTAHYITVGRIEEFRVGIKADQDAICLPNDLTSSLQLQDSWHGMPGDLVAIWGICRGFGDMVSQHHTIWL